MKSFASILLIGAAVFAGGCGSSRARPAAARVNPDASPVPEAATIANPLLDSGGASLLGCGLHGRILEFGSNERTVEPHANVLPARTLGHFEVNFDDHEAIAAIIETGRVTGTEVFLPCAPAGAPDWGVAPIEDKSVTLFAESVTADHILRELARLGGLTVEVFDIGDAVGYWFKYQD